LSINLVSNLNQVFEWESRPDFTFRVYGTNLLDEGIYLPEFGRRNINTLPHASGRAFFAEVSVAF